MSKTDPASAKLAALNALRDNLRSPDSTRLLRRALEDRTNRVVQRAADLIADTEDATFVPDLQQAYRRLLDDPLKTDPGCAGKTAIVRALIRLDSNDTDFYRAGTEYQQPEPVWGQSVDSAAELRGLCAAGLIGCASNLEVLNRCAVLLVDPSPEARSGAARAAAGLGQPEGAPLLRLKLFTGDKIPEVLGECCAALLKLDREQGVETVAQLLSQHDPDVCIHAALALGESRLPKAFDVLRQAWDRQFDAGVRETFLTCIALLRSANAFDFLLSLIQKDDLRTSTDAIKALHAYGKTSDLRERTEAAVKATDNARLEKVFQEVWGSEP